MRALAERFYNETARIETILLLAAMMVDESLPQALTDFFGEDWETLEGVLGPIPDYVKEESEGSDNDELICWLQREGKIGFLVQVATPVMRYRGNNSHSFSWGHYKTKWFYGDTLDAAIEAGFAFVEAQRADEKAEYERLETATQGV